MNMSDTISSVTSSSFTESYGRDGVVWFEEHYFLIEDITELTLKTTE